MKAGAKARQTAVPVVVDGERLARLVARAHPELSYTRAKQAVLDGQVTVDGKVVHEPGRMVGPTAKVAWEASRPHTRPRKGPEVELVHVDGEVIVAAKPAGLLTLPTPLREKATLQDRVSMAIGSGADRPFVSVVHRLDKETSGLVVFARSHKSLRALQGGLEDGTLERIYEALVEGEIGLERGRFDRALVGDGTHRRRWVAGPTEIGKPAVTHWKVVRRFAGATLVEARLETGRTHQIRIHFAAEGHPVVGDKVYRPGEGWKSKITAPRQMLHARKLSFTHPTTGKRLVFEMPRPADFAKVLTQIGR